jgi:hypothetical protein
MSKSSREIADRKVMQQGAVQMEDPIAAEGFDFGRLRHERRPPVSV